MGWFNHQLVFSYHNLPQCMIAADFSPQFLKPRRAPLQAQFSNAPLLNTQPFQQQQQGAPRNRVSRGRLERRFLRKSRKLTENVAFSLFLGSFYSEVKLWNCMRARRMMNLGENCWNSQLTSISCVFLQDFCCWHT